MRAFLLAMGLAWSPVVGAQALVEPHHRFDMTQNGQQMSAQDFDRWLQQRGVRIVGRKTAAPVRPTFNTVRPLTPLPTPIVDEKIRAAGPGTIVGF